MTSKLNVVPIVLCLSVWGCLDTTPDDHFNDSSTAGSGESGSSSKDAGKGGHDGGGSTGSGSAGKDAGTSGSDAPGGMSGSDSAGTGGSESGTGGIAGSDTSGTGGAGTSGDAGQDAGPCGGTCEGDTPVCDPDSGACVACVEKSDCDGDDVCSAEHVCVRCVNTDDCNQGQVCSPEHECVQCVADEDCDDVNASQCDTAAHACISCEQDDQCERFGDTPYCDEDRGRCSTCTADTEAAVCTGNKACALSTGSCTGTDRTSLNSCSPCEADSECKAGMKCVEHLWGDPEQSVGHYCFFVKTVAGCALDDSSKQPYSQEVTTASIDDAAGTYCVPRATCQALIDTAASKDCAGDDECGVVGMADGHCVDPGEDTSRCTYECVDDIDCPTLGFPHCIEASDEPAYCQP